MDIKIKSLIGLGLTLLGAFFLYEKNYIFSKNSISIILQLCALGLMIWARLTFGMRSFHAAANATQGELVTTGPYHWLRHPIYAALIYLSLASLIAYPFWETFGAFCLIIIGLSIRIYFEEKSLRIAYDAYGNYCKKTKRIIPFLF